MSEDADALGRHHLLLARASGRADLTPLSPQNLDALADAGSQRSVEAGTLLAAGKAPVHHIFVILSGEVHLAARGPSGGRRTIGVAQELSVFGDIPLLCGHPMPFDAITARPTRVIAVPAPAFLQLLTSSGTLALHWAMSVAKRLEITQRRMLSMMTKDLPGQVATFLLEERRPDEHGRSGVKLTQETIAHMLGARRQSVARVLKDLRERSIVSASYGATVVLDEEALARAAGEALHDIPCSGATAADGRTSAG